MEKAQLALSKMHAGEYPFAFTLEGGPVCEYQAWRDMITRPEWLLLSIYKGDYMQGWLGLERLKPEIAQLHISLARKSLTPQETQWVVTEAGSYCFHMGIQELRAIMLLNNRAARRLAERSGMWFDCLEIKNKLPHARYILTKEVFFTDPDKRWGNYGN